MADRYLVRERIDAGRRLLDRLAANRLDVAGAYWAIRGDRDSWELYVIAPSVDTAGSLDAYGKVGDAFRSLSEEDQDAIGLFGVRLEGLRSRVAAGVLEHVRQHPRAAGNRLETTLLGGEWIESLFAYPAAVLAPTPA